MRSIFSKSLTFVAKRHAMWLVLPFLVTQALATVPTKAGILCTLIATCIFLFTLFGWRSSV